MFEPLLEKLCGKRIVFATSSRQRQFLLRQTRLNFDTFTSNFAENLDKNKFSPEEYVVQTALGKMEDVKPKLLAQNPPADIIMTVDTMVFHKGILIGKPASADDSFNTLKSLINSDIPHDVYSGMAIYYQGKTETFVEGTKVYLSKLTDDEIWDYVKTGEPTGKAGSYAIQMLASTFVKRIEGDYFNVIGVPLCRLTETLKKIVA